jgi:hypothetical protein
MKMQLDLTKMKGETTYHPELAYLKIDWCINCKKLIHPFDLREECKQTETGWLCRNCK